MYLLYGNCTPRTINWEHFLPSNLCTHTMLDAQHKTLTGEKTLMSHYVDNTYCTALQLWQDQHTFLYLVVMSYSHTTWALNCMYNTAKAYLVKVVNFYKFTGKAVIPTCTNIQTHTYSTKTSAVSHVLNLNCSEKLN